jgi:two-component system chemotaxis response regulator CheB
MPSQNTSPNPHGHDIIVLGASAGGVEALREIAACLPSNLPAAVFVVVHMKAQAPGLLPTVLNRAGPLPAFAAVDGMFIERGRIYVAVPDYHLLVERARVRLVRGPRENRSRPAVDALFRSAARTYGPRVVGVVLTGALDDGTAGLLAIKRCGGIAVVQDPDDARVPSMPASALEYIDVDYRVCLRAMAPLLFELAHTPNPAKGDSPVPEDIDLESRIAAMDLAALENDNRPGQLSGFTCPECQGPLWEVRDGQLLRFRCRSGHAYTTESILAGQAEAVEDALWTALNVLQESVQVAHRLAGDARARNNPLVAKRLDERARERLRQVEVLRKVLLNGSMEAVEDIEDIEEMNVQDAERDTEGGTARGAEGNAEPDVESTAQPEVAPSS